MNDIALICVTHDPFGKNINLVKKLSTTLSEIYMNMFITVSEETDKYLINELIDNGFNVKIIPKKGAAHARREALKFALTGINQYFHYCDFDRLLTWADRYRDELKNTVIEIPKNDFTILGRTERAFNTHPIEWVETEKITNKIFSLELGQNVDITAGSCGFSRNSAQLISSNSKDKMTDAEWPMIVYRIGKMKIGYKAVEGLEYREEVNGYSREIEDSEKWFGRVRLCYIISQSAINTGK
ncbi:hypothetical protein CSC2_34850 [Clostridium zeae]|uniref:Glycosyltransferase family 2 protein n=1 Tax=Clostridium zeae TaxID=2759022 RepID=A0ABQ1EDR4_9CLOT|nr:hypothetical protein [Clostridium zeae]GFZ32959.1 hypothetical protein CSC2_34850 [Clostridium zeae]